MHFAPDPYPAPLDGFRLLAPAQFVPVRLFHDTADTIHQPMADDRMPRRRHVALAHRIHQLELGRIETELLGRLVHHQVECVICLHDAIAAKGPGDRRVRVDAAAFETHIFAAIERGQCSSADIGYAWTVRSVGPGIERDPGFAGDDAAIPGEALLEPDLAGVTRAAAQECFLPAELHLDGAPGPACKQRAEEFVLKQILLCAEASAHVVDDHAYLVQRHAEHFGEGAADHEGTLRRGPHGQLAVAVPLADTDVRLHIGRSRAAEIIFALDNQIRFFKALVDVAPRDEDRRQHVILTEAVLMNWRCRGIRCRFDGEEAGQRVVFDLDECDRPLGNFLTDGSDGGNALAPVAYPLVQDVLVLCNRCRAWMRRAGMQHARNVLVGQHRLHSLERQRLGRIDAFDARMRDVAALHLGIEHAGQSDVSSISRRPRHLFQRIGTLDAFAHDGEIPFGQISVDSLMRVHSVPALLNSSAVALTASMILV